MSNEEIGIGLRQYLLPGIEIEWLKAYRDSLRRHIFFVRLAGQRIDVPQAQLAVHDQSKYSMQEFPFYARNFYGDKGDPLGYTQAWLHHQNHNPHHWEYWVLRGPVSAEEPEAKIIDPHNRCLPMPEKYAKEMIADWLGASRAYTGSWDVSEWWQKNRERIRLHPDTFDFVEQYLNFIDFGRAFPDEASEPPVPSVSGKANR